jgi:NAD dependent epimerase/dehydratase family
MNAPTKVMVAGARGMVGSAIVRALEKDSAVRILAPSRHELNLMDAQAVHAYLREQKPQQVYVAAAKVGGILANNSRPADFLYDNLLIECNLIHAAFVRIPSKADSDSGDGGHPRSVATQVVGLFIRLSAMLQDGVLFAHGFLGRELDAVSVVHESVEDGIGEAPAAEVLVPVAHR